VTPSDEPPAVPRERGGAAALTPRARQIASVARELLETEGPEALSMRRIADRLGIRAPSLYKHVPDKAALEAALIAAGFEELAERFGAAGTAGDLRAVARAYREWALEHPHLYRLMTQGRLPRERLPEGVEASAAAPVIAATGGDPDAARAAFAFAHGMVILELDDRFPPGADLDAAWECGITGLSPRPPRRGPSARN
jgi:AcrR family transcriptional regulator